MLEGKLTHLPPHCLCCTWQSSAPPRAPCRELPPGTHCQLGNLKRYKSSSPKGRAGYIPLWRLRLALEQCLSVHLCSGSVILGHCPWAAHLRPQCRHCLVSPPHLACTCTDTGSLFVPEAPQVLFKERFRPSFSAGSCLCGAAVIIHAPSLHCWGEGFLPCSSWMCPISVFITEIGPIITQSKHLRVTLILPASL